MPLRFGPGPVFAYESVAAARRWQTFAQRASAALALLAGLTAVRVLMTSELAVDQSGVSIRQLAELGAYFYYAISTVLVAMMLAVAPASTAGAVCLDRARGALTHMLVTDLTDAEIVLGKLAARLAPVVGALAATVPLLALTTLLGGVDPAALVTLTALCLAVAVLGCALALAVSVRATKTHEVLMAVYAVWTCWTLMPGAWTLFSWLGLIRRVPDRVLKANPFVLAWAPHAWPGYTGPGDLAVFAAWTSALSACLVAYSVFRLRGEVSGGTVGRRVRPPGGFARVRSWWPGPSLDGNPVLWREWHRARPSRLARAVWWLYGLGSLAATTWAAVLVLRRGGRVVDQSLLFVSAFEVFLGLLLVSLSAPTALAEERARGSLDVLMTTPLSTASIVLAKWWGAYRVVPKLALLPAFGAALLALTVPEVVTTGRMGPGSPLPVTPFDRIAAVVFPVAWVFAQGAVVTSVGLALATWIPRLGRAVAVSVSGYVVVSVVWMMSLEMGVAEWCLTCFGFPEEVDNEVSILIALGSVSPNPFGGQFVPGFVLSNSFGVERMVFWLSQTVLLAMTAGFAAWLLGLTILTFEPCLGRVTARGANGPAGRRSARSAGRVSGCRERPGMCFRSGQ